MNAQIKLPPRGVGGNQPVRVVVLTITDNERPGVLSFDFNSDDLRPARKSKNVPEHQKFEEVKITFPAPVYVDRIEVSRDGRRVDVIGRPSFLVQEPKFLKPSFVELVGYYERKKQRKVLYRYACRDRYAPANIHWVLSEWSSFFVIDTNTRLVDGHQASMTAVIEGRLMVTLDSGPGFKLESLYTDCEIAVCDNPERAAMLKLADKIETERGVGTDQKFGIITDSEAQLVDAYNARSEPIYADRVLPERFHVMYASDAGGRDAYLPNKLMALCDRRSAAALATLRVS